jgi:ribose 5-phosphate isomerase B
MRLVTGSDHAGWALKGAVVGHIRKLGHEVVDAGCHDDTPVDFPDVARAVAARIVAGEVERGIGACGTGVAASSAASKMKGIRAAVCRDVHSAHQSVEHDDVNVMCTGAQMVGPRLAADLITACPQAHVAVHGEDFRRRVGKLHVMDTEP